MVLFRTNESSSGFAHCAAEAWVQRGVLPGRREKLLMMKRFLINKLAIDEFDHSLKEKMLRSVAIRAPISSVLQGKVYAIVASQAKAIKPITISTSLLGSLQ